MVDAKENVFTDGYWNQYKGNIQRSGYLEELGCDELGCDGICGSADSTCITSELQSEITTFQLGQPYPNPSISQNIIIPFTIEKPAKISIKIYNLYGQLVKTLFNDKIYTISNDYIALWKPGKNLASGIYFVSMFVEIDNTVYSPYTKKIILLK